MASRYAHAKQFKRMKKMNNKLKSRLGRVKRDIWTTSCPIILLIFSHCLKWFWNRAQKLIEQEQHSKNKLYSLHAPEVECVSKGKAHKPYEFGVKASIAVWPTRKALLLGLKVVQEILMMDIPCYHNWSR